MFYIYMYGYKIRSICGCFYSFLCLINPVNTYLIDDIKYFSDIISVMKSWYILVSM